MKNWVKEFSTIGYFIDNKLVGAVTFKEFIRNEIKITDILIVGVYSDLRGKKIARNNIKKSKIKQS